MKLSAIVKDISPDVLLKKNFKTYTLLLFCMLMYSQIHNTYSFSSNNAAIDEFNDSKSKHFIDFSTLTFSNQDWIHPRFLDFAIPYTSKNGLANQITISSVLNTSYCTGESGTITFEVTGVFNVANKFSVQLSNFNGSFVSPTVIGFINSAATGTNTASFKIPTNMPIGNGYRMRISASSPATNSGNNGANIQITTLAIPSVTVSTQIICPGSTANLVATCSSGTVKWYDALEGGNVITNLTVSPTVSTDYFAACVDGANCVSLRAKQIIIVNNPEVLIPPNASSCLNSNLELAVVTDETNLSYAWSGPNSFSSILQNPTITNLTTVKEGIYSVRITNANSCTVTGTTSVTIGQVLQSLNVVGNVTICFSDTINLQPSTSVPSGMTYSWSGPDSYTATGQNFSRPASTINGNGSISYHNGLYTVVANNATTGCTGTTSVDITVGNRPNIPIVLPATSVCEGVNYSLNLAISGANFRNYLWTGPNNFTASALAICNTNNNCNDTLAIISNFSSINTGIYSLRATFTDENNILCVVRTTKNISLSLSPDISLSSNSAVCVGDVLNFYTNYTPTITEIASYSWSGPNSFSSSVQNPVFYTNTVTGTGIYKLTAVGVNSCIATATTLANIVESVPPLIVPTANVVLSNTITLDANGCSGTIQWYKSSDNQSVTMPISPINDTQYHARCNTLGCVSGKSGDILVTVKPPIAISTKTGDWEDKTTWDILRVPLEIDSVIIRPDHFISVHSLVYAKWLAWSGFGNLHFVSPISKLQLFGITPPPTPVISSDPASVMEGIPVTFTASGSATITWFKNGTSLNVIGSSYTVSQPIRGDIYTAIASTNSVNSGVSNAITVLNPPNPVIVSPPVISSNPSTVIEGISVSFTATGSGIITWYKNGVNLNINGSSYTVSQPVRDDVYTAKATIGNAFSGFSNAITVGSTASTGVTPPVISSNPVNIVENIPVIFTAAGSGDISWYKNGVNLNISGTNYGVNQPIRGDTYTAKRTVNGVVSDASNGLTVVAGSANVTITEPNKPPYYFSDGHPPSYYDGNLNLPAIITNQPRYDPVNDMVWLTNDKIKIGINLKRGGQLAWASLIDATTNLVYNGYDGGFQVTLDAYQKKDGYTQGGEVAGSAIPGMPTSYNVIQGGDYLNHAATLIDYHSIPNGYYVKLRPIHYPLNGKHSQTFIEATYTIIRRSVKIEYRYTSFRTDGQWNGGGFDGAGAPSCFIVNTLNKYKSYTGNSPWSFLPLAGGTLPITNMGQNPAEAQATEYWGMVYDEQRPNSGIGVYNATNGGNSTYFIFKQIEVYPGNGPGTEFNSGATFFQPFIDFSIPNRGSFTKNVTAYLMIGSEQEIRSEVYKFSGHEGNIPSY